MVFLENVSLSEYTTFKIGGTARYFCVVKDEVDIHEVQEFINKKQIKFFILGKGSNVLISDKGFDGLVIKMETKGILYERFGSGVLVTAMAGESWSDFVTETVNANIWGLENLSLIPGTVGASAVQNIGAYGVEVKDLIKSVRVINILTGKEEVFSNKECKFDYRYSFFKREDTKNFVILSVTFLLSYEAKPNISYKDLQEYFATVLIKEPTLKDIADAVTSIRLSKFPNLAKIGTAGSFWKNPIISEKRYKELQILYSGMPGFVFDAVNFKISLAWILDRVCGLKGYNEGRVSLFKNQPLILVTEHGATKNEVDIFADKIATIVREKTGIVIEREVESVG